MPADADALGSNAVPTSTTASTTASVWATWRDDDDVAGVREPRRPITPTLSGAAVLDGFTDGAITYDPSGYDDGPIFELPENDWGAAEPPQEAAQQDA